MREGGGNGGGPKLMPEVSIYAMLEQWRGAGREERERGIFIYGWINETTREGRRAGCDT